MLIQDMPLDEYHRHPALSKTNLDWLERSPGHYRYWVDNPPDSTPAMIKGNAFHTATLEPEKFEERFAVWSGAKRGKAWDAFCEAHHDKHIISEEDAADVRAMAQAVWNHPSASTLLNNSGLIEPSFFIEILGVPCKIRPDFYISTAGGIIVDLKSATNASLEAFSRAIYIYRYHVQAAFYVDGVIAAGQATNPRFIFIAVEKDPPYAVACYRAPLDMLDIGRRAYQRNLATYKLCAELSHWPLYSEYINNISLPGWATRKETYHD